MSLIEILLDHNALAPSPAQGMLDEIAQALCYAQLFTWRRDRLRLPPLRALRQEAVASRSEMPSRLRREPRARWEPGPRLRCEPPADTLLWVLRRAMLVEEAPLCGSGCDCGCGCGCGCGCSGSKSTLTWAASWGASTMPLAWCEDPSC